MKKILLVDDDLDILEALRLTFDEAGYQVESTAKGEEIDSLIQKHNPDAIILDVLLSGNDGRIICKKLKNSSKTKNIPIIMISAHPDAAKSTIAAGANAFLAKPFDIYELMNKVETLL